MNTTPCSPGVLPRCLLASLLLSPLPLAAQTITNPGFEANTTFTAFPGYVSGNGPITGWIASPADRVGLNPTGGATPNPFANNGQIPGGNNVAFLQAGNSGVASLKTTVTGLVPNTKYNVSFRVNARTQGTQNFPFMTFSTNGTGPTVVTEIARVSDAINTTPYHHVAFEFTATAASQEITISNIRTTGDHTLLVDEFAIAPSSNAWNFAAWTGDADSGIDPQYVYTHAYSFGTNAGVSVNGVRFIGREGGSPGRFALSGLNSGFTDRTPNNVTGDSAKLAEDFRYGGSPGITLQHLKPNTQYVTTIYGIGFDAPDSGTPHRSATFSSSAPGSQRFTVNLSHYGQGNGIAVNYKFTTDALGTPVTISYPTHGTGSFHTSGFSNREAVARTPVPAWTSVQWFDDESSGIDGTYHYTHAFNFGTATSVNVNGVNFTGIAGANPVGTNYTSTLPLVFNNDFGNAISGVSELLTRDFVHGGFPEVHTLSGLTPGKEYVFTIHSTGWEAPGIRLNALYGNVEDDPIYLDQSEFGANNGIRLEYRYTAKADGTAVIQSSSFTENASIHVCAISNREADPLVAVAPAISQQPADVFVGEGSSHTLRVGATGSPELSYQWKKNNQDIGGATSSTLELFEITFADAGDYTVVITNDDGTVTSEAATVTVYDNVQGVFGSGVGPDGFPLANGAVDPHFTLIANPDNPNSSEVRVGSNIAGSWIPNSGESKWIGPRTDTGGAAGAPTADGEGEGVYVYRTQLDLTGFDPATVIVSGRWASDNAGITIRVNGTAVTGTENATGVTFGLWKDFILSSSNATFTAGINNLDFVVKNETVGLTGLRVERIKAIGFVAPNTAPHIAVQPVGGAARHNQNVVLGVSANGSFPLEYEWYFNDELISGETMPFLSVNVGDLSAAGAYKVKVINGAGNVTSNVATITVTNANPVTEFDTVAATKDTPLEIEQSVLLTNDTDADLDPLDVTAVSAASAQGGTVVLIDGLITYTPPAGFTGSDSFTYTVTDGVWGGSAIGNVLVNVSEAAAGPPGQITLSLSGGTATGTFVGTPGVSYTIQRSTNLVDWADLETKVAPPSGTVVVQDGNPPQGKAFYRIVYGS